jgi:hypothetical protein
MEYVFNKENWNELKIKLMKAYPQLTNSDLEHKEGMEQGMLRMVEYKLHMTKQELKEIIAEL